ncbi:hypothetical protein Tco_0668435 [Tanacetum coccineum]
MVACCERTEENAEFHQIVDFLTTSSIHYALTVSPTIYASYIEQFWNTANSQTVNDVKQIHATVDGKTVVISESSVRSDLHFNDEDGITCLTNTAIFENLALMGYESDSDKLTFQKALFSPQWKYLIHTILHCLSSKSTSWNEFSTNIASAVICLATGQKFNFSKLIFDGMLRNLDTNTKKFLMYPRFLQLFLNNQISLTEPFNDTYETPKHTKKVFTNMKIKGKDFSGRVTLLFASMLAPPIVRGEGSGQPSEPQPPSSTTQPIIEEQILVTELSSPQNTQSPRQALQKDTQLPQTSVPIPNVADEVVFKERDDRVVRATTTAASIDAAQANGDRPRCQEAMRGAIAQTRSERTSKHSYDSPLPGVNTPESDKERNKQQDLTDLYHQHPMIHLSQELQKKGKRLEKALRARTPGMKLFKIGTSRDKENVSKQGRKSDKTKPMFKDSDFDVLDDAMENVEGGSTAEQITTAGDTLNTASINVSTAGLSNGNVVGPSTSTTGDIFEDEMTTIADTLMAIKSERPRTTSVVIQEQEQFEREQKIARERAAEQEAKDVALIEEMEDILGGNHYSKEEVLYSPESSRD